MLKTLALVCGGLVAGIAIALLLQPGSGPAVEAGAARTMAPTTRPTTDDDAPSDARLAALEDAFDAEVEQRVALETRVAELSAQLEALGERPLAVRRGDGSANGGLDPAVVEERARVRREARVPGEQREQRTVDRLVAAGFPPDRAEWINRRTQELRMQAMQAQYEARREGKPPPPDLGEATLRTELGDQDYERFLTAMGRPTNVSIMGVLASSPAERAGLQEGDEIVAYNGQRVFDIAQLNEMTLGGTTGESVVVDVRRNGQNMQLVLPRGPIGIWAGFRGAPVPAER